MEKTTLAHKSEAKKSRWQPPTHTHVRQHSSQSSCSGCGACHRIARSTSTNTDASASLMLKSLDPGKKVCATSFLQRTYGNQYVQRLIQTKKDSPCLERCGSRAIQMKSSGCCGGCANHGKEEEEAPMQAKLAIGKPGDKYEQEADRVADTVMRLPEPEVQRQPEEEEEIQMQAKELARQITPLVQRQPMEEEEEELQAKEASGRTPTPDVTPDLETSLNAHQGGGQPMPETDRSFMERRFGSDFSGVRVHTDSNAVQMNKGLNAEAFTYGNNIYFGAGRYSPSTNSGQRLLAHELTHVVQQGTIPRTMRQTVRSETVPPRIFRRVASRLVNCPAGTHGAPANPVNALTTLDAMAGAFSTMVSSLLAIESALTGAGFRNPASPIQQAYQNRFGLPPARPGGFLNRLTGTVRPTQNQAISEELRLLSRRFGIIARMFSQWIHYRCIGGASTFAGCAPPHCNAFAWSCGGIFGVIFLCPMFWTRAGITQQQQAGILIHEAAHINWTAIGHGAGGPGGNFRHAECYASFVADVIGFPSPVAPCPAPPP